MINLFIITSYNEIDDSPVFFNGFKFNNINNIIEPIFTNAEHIDATPSVMLFANTNLANHTLMELHNNFPEFQCKIIPLTTEESFK